MKITDEQQIAIDELELIINQLNKAIDIIANTAGDYTQNIVYDALVESGYYKEEEEEEEE